MSTNSDTNPIELLLEELLKISTDVTENQEVVLSNLTEVYSKHLNIIDYIQGDSTEIQEIKKIKKDKNYLKKYISAFEQYLKFSNFTHDVKNIQKIETDIEIFTLFQQDIEQFHKLQTYIYTKMSYYSTIPYELTMLKRKAKKRRGIPQKEKIFLQRYQQTLNIHKSLKFFKYHPLTKKNLQTSLAITLYKYLSKIPDISKYKTKELVETFLHQIDMPTTIKIDKLKEPFIKTIIDDLLILSYPSSKDIDSLVDFEKIDTAIKNKSQKASQSPHLKTRQEKYNAKYTNGVLNTFTFLRG